MKSAVLVGHNGTLKQVHEWHIVPAIVSQVWLEIYTLNNIFIGTDSETAGEKG